MVSKRIVSNYVISQVNKQIYLYFEQNKNKILADLKRDREYINLVNWLKFNNIHYCYPKLIYYYDDSGEDLTNYQNLLCCYLFNNVLLRFTDVLSIVVKDPDNSDSRGINISSKYLINILEKKINILVSLKNEIDLSNLILVKYH